MIGQLVDKTKPPLSDQSFFDHKRKSPMNRQSLIKILLAFAALFTFFGNVQAQNASALEAKYQQLQNKLANNQFNQPIYMDSNEQSNKISGNVYSVVNYPYSTVRTALDTPTEWCEVLMLHLNVKYCRALSNNKIEVYAGTKKPEPLKNAYKMTYNFKPVINNDNYMQIIMDAKSGPVGTSDYYMMMEAIPLSSNRTFIHITYSYRFGTMAKIATNLYLDTAGRGKEGFTIVGKKTNGAPEYVTGLRGAIERNTMRYYLAVEAYLGSLSAPPAQQREKRLKAWFKATERYPQLYEITEKQYLSMKQEEFNQTPPNN